MTEPAQPDALRNLVLFLVGLAILGTVIAVIVNFVVVVPAEQGLLPAPANTLSTFFGINDIIHDKLLLAPVN